MWSATLLPEPDSPLTMTSRIDQGAIEFVGERVDRRIHVVFGRLGVDLVSPQHEGCFCLVAELLDREHAVNIDELFEVP